MEEFSKPLRGEIKVSLRFVGDEVDPRVVTAALGLQPTKAHLKGEPSGKPSGHVYVTGYWGISSPYTTDQPFQKHLEYFLDLMEPRISALERLRGSGLSPNLFCGFFPTEEELSAYIRFDSATLARLVGIGASIDCHVYSP